MHTEKFQYLLPYLSSRITILISGLSFFSSKENQIHIFISFYLSVYIYIFMCTYCVYIYYVYIFLYTHTHTHYFPISHTEGSYCYAYSLLMVLLFLIAHPGNHFLSFHRNRACGFYKSSTPTPRQS